MDNIDEIIDYPDLEDMSDDLSITWHRMVNSQIVEYDLVTGCDCYLSIENKDFNLILHLGIYCEGYEEEVKDYDARFIYAVPRKYKDDYIIEHEYNIVRRKNKPCKFTLKRTFAEET
jgi:hypothetical protein